MKEPSGLDRSWNAVGLLNRESESGSKQKWSGLPTVPHGRPLRGYLQHKGELKNLRSVPK